jgi:protein-S-isoprenylcysteine O-methyltransferase Ste14
MALSENLERINRTRLALNLMAAPLFFALFLFLPAGTWKWPKGWLFVLVVLTAGGVGLIYLWWVNPELVTARINSHQGTKPWDLALLSAYFTAFLSIFPLAALDDGRFHWLPLPEWAWLLGYILLLAGMVLMTWAMSVNKFFEPTVRLQADRGQRVIDTGPYALVRHPGYASCFPLLVGIALCLGSVWALIPATLAFLVLLVRAQWEDQALQVELAGYHEYTKRVRYRLCPGVW